MEDILNLIDSSFYILLTWVLALSYIFLMMIFYLYMKESIRHKSLTAISVEKLKSFFTNSTMKIFMIFFLGSNVTLYTVQRGEWINKHTINHNAKEYFVAGMPIVFYKKGLNLIFSADSIVMAPFNFLSQSLYVKGVKLLPKDDGEKYYWRYRFFNYWYIRGAGYMPDNDYSTPKPITKQQQEILYDMYEVIQGLATSNIADKTVNEERYKAFVSVAFYYNTYKLIQYNEYIIDNFSDRARVALQDKEYLQKNSNILKWTLKFQQEYKQNNKLKEVIENENPILWVSYYVLLHDTSEDFIFKMIIENRLDCNSQYIDIYLNSSRDLIKIDSPFYKMSQSQQEIIKLGTFDTYMHHFNAYMLKKECNKEIGIGYPTQEWIKTELPSLKERWLKKEDANTSVWQLNNTKPIHELKGQ